MQGRGRRREAGLRDGRTDIRRGEEGGAGPAWRGGGRPCQEESVAMLTGVVPLPATGAPRPAARKCRKERDKAADAQAAVHSILRNCQKRIGMPGQAWRNAAGWRGYDFGNAGNAACLETRG